MIPGAMLPLIYKMFGHCIFLGSVMGGVLAQGVDFRAQITLGSILIAALILAIAGLITIRSKIANIWREEAEGERAAKDRCQEELTELKLFHLEFEKQQQDIRHELKNTIAGLTAQVKVLEARTDLTQTLSVLKDIENEQHENNLQTHNLLMEIRDKLPSEPLKIQEPILTREVGKE